MIMSGNISSAYERCDDKPKEFRDEKLYCTVIDWKNSVKLLLKHHETYENVIKLLSLIFWHKARVRWIGQRSDRKPLRYCDIVGDSIVLAATELGVIFSATMAIMARQTMISRAIKEVLQKSNVKFQLGAGMHGSLFKQVVFPEPNGNVYPVYIADAFCWASRLCEASKKRRYNINEHNEIFCTREVLDDIEMMTSVQSEYPWGKYSRSVILGEFGKQPVGIIRLKKPIESPRIYERYVRILKTGDVCMPKRTSGGIMDTTPWY